MIRLLSAIIITIATASCASVKHVDSKQFQDLSALPCEEELDTFHLGRFKNSAAQDSFDGYSLWHLLEPKADTSNPFINTEVEIVLINQYTLKALLIKNGQTIDSTSCKYTSNCEFLELERRYNFHPGIIIISAWSSSVVKLAQRENGDLVVISHSAAIATALGIIPFFGANPVPTETSYPLVERE